MSAKKIPLKSTLEQQLTTSRSYLNNILAILPEHIYWMDLEGKIIGCNEQQAKSFGLSSVSELIGMNIYDIAKLLNWDKDIPRAIRNNDIAIMATKKPKIVEEIVTLQGKKRVFLSHKSPLYDDNRKVIGIIGVATDITKIKEAQVKISQLEKDKTIIETKQQVISDFATSIAHEIGNLLSGTTINMQLLGYKLKPKITELLEKHDDKCQEVLELFNNLEKSMQNANLMFESIKMNIRSGTINKSQLELRNIAEDIETVLTGCFPGEDIIANIKWNKEENFEYVGIPAYTRNVLINLIKNAVYFIKEEKRGEITITLKKGEKFNQLIFEDTAKGIPVELLLKIFTRFSTTRKGGSGMGLAFCKMVMQEYGGDITCESDPGKYTRFILTFPTIVVEQ